MLETLRDCGYTVGEIDADDLAISRKLQEMYAGHLTVGTVSGAEIRDWVHDLPPQYEALFYDTWGQPPSTIPIKGLRYGNVLVLLQDMRGMEDLSAIHDKQAPPSPWLLASYRYATRRFNADAMVHVGTHGLVEWSRGKEWCPAHGDYPEFLIDGCPHAYIFNVLDPVEASIARRRSYATILSHLCPPLARSKAARICATCTVWSTTTTTRTSTRRRSAPISPPRSRKSSSGPGCGSKRRAARTAISSRKSTTSWSRSKASSRPAGQHVFGRNLGEEDRLDTFHACLEYCDVDLYRLLANCYGLDYDALNRRPDRAPPTGPTTTTFSTSCAKPARR